MSRHPKAQLTVSCPKCGAEVDVSGEAILAEVKREPALRGKVASLLGSMTGGKTRLGAEERRQRALKAVRAREAKRKKEQS